MKHIETVTMGKRGPHLPVGIERDGGVRVVRNFDFWPRMFEHDMAFDANAVDVGMGGQITVATAVALKQWGDKTWKVQWPEDPGWDKEFVERCAALRSSFAGDVFYAYFYHGVTTNGWEYPCEIICPAAAHPEDVPREFKVTLDFKTLEIDVLPDKSDQRRFLLDLPAPLNLRDGQHKKIAIRPCYWSSMEDGLDSPDRREYNLLTLQGSICGLGSVPKDDAADGTTLSDMEIRRCFPSAVAAYIRREASRFGCGPRLGIDTQCPHCGFKITWPFDWSYAAFFTRSSLGLIGTS